MGLISVFILLSIKITKKTHQEISTFNNDR